MTNEEAIEVLAQDLPCETDEDLVEAMAMAIKALETVSCIKEKCAYCPHCENCDVDDETLEIKALEQQEKTAAWVPIDAEPQDIYECNACGWLLYYEDRTDFKFCPNCGARMVSE